jgi:hypothetical protein
MRTMRCTNYGSQAELERALAARKSRKLESVKVEKRDAMWHVEILYTDGAEVRQSFGLASDALEYAADAAFQVGQ